MSASQKGSRLSEEDSDTIKETGSDPKRSPSRSSHHKYKNKEYKHKDSYRSRHHHRHSRSRRRSRDRSRHYYEDRDRDRSRDRRHRSHRYHRSRSRRSRSRNRRRSRTRSYSSQKKEITLPVAVQREKDNFDIKKKIEEMTKPINENIPTSTTEKSKRDRELYVTNLPNNLSTNDIVNLLNTALISIEANTKRGDPIISAWTNTEQEYTLLEFRSVEECNNAYKINGMSLLSKPIKIGKPIYSDETDIKQTKDMFPTLSSFEKDLNSKALNSTNNSNSFLSSSSMRQSSNNNNIPATSKLQVSNIPKNFEESDIKQFFKMFGRIKSIEMLKDPTTNKFNGQCNLEYETEKSTQDALHYSIGIQLQNNILYIKRITTISQGNSKGLGILTSSVNSSLPSLITEDYIKFRENNPSKVICIKNMVTIKELDDNDEYEDFYDDVLVECKNYGKVIQIKIPRPNGEYGVTGIGKVFVEYANRDGAAWAKKNLNGTNFKDRIVEVVYHPEESFKKNQFD